MSDLFDRHLRRALRAHIDPIPALKGDPGSAALEAGLILKRMRSEDRNRRVVSSAATAASILLVFVLLVSLPRFLPAPARPISAATSTQAVKTQAPSPTSTGRPTRLPAETLTTAANVAAPTAQAASQITVLASDRYIYRISLDANGGAAQEKLSAVPEAAPIEMFSPDGTQLAYTSAWPGTERWLYLINVDGSGKEQVLRGDFQSSPTWSPDGKQIAILVEGKQGWQLAIIQRNGGQADVRYFPLNGTSQLPPIWSPDGTKIALAISKSQGYWAGPYFLDLSAGKDSRIQPVNVPGFWDWGVTDITWTPDSQQMAYQAWDANNSRVEIRSVRPDGSSFRTLTKYRLEKWRNLCYPHLTWSPDGRFLIWVHIKQEKTAGYPLLMRLDSQTGEATPIWDHADLNLDSPIWSPDGRQILFENSSGLWILDAAHPDASPQKISDLPIVLGLMWK